MRILVVEDDRLLNNTLCYNLDAAGYVVDSALTKSAASNFLTKQDYDLIVLDVNLPDGNGFDFCREVKERRPDTAVIFLTANDMESDMLKGYELGAEDYVTKPFNILELKARIKAIMRRNTRRMKKEEKPGSRVISAGDLKLDTDSRRVFIADREINLTAKEFDLLELFVCHPNKVYSREELLGYVWGNKAAAGGDVRTVDVHVRRLREKIEPSPSDPKYVHTKWGVGYYFRA